MRIAIGCLHHTRGVLDSEFRLVSLSESFLVAGVQLGENIFMYYIGVLYAASQTYTATVFEHLDAFRKYSSYEFRYIDFQDFDKRIINLGLFDALIVHYSVRLPFNQLGERSIEKLKSYDGLKLLFIQDEYNNTNLSIQTMQAVCFDIVYTVVPACSIQKIYPRDKLPNTKFINCFTGYVPENIDQQIGTQIKPSSRRLTVAYRGRPLPVWYGKLGLEKVEIGRGVKEYCEKYGISCDIEWEESARIYGNDWYRFICSARSMLGSESGSNVFDWNGSLREEVREYRRRNPQASMKDVYDGVIQKHEIDGLMNQISPRIFEMAAAKTAMILFEGEYSGVLIPGIHYLSLDKDFRNLGDIIATISDDIALDEMVDRTYQDVILSDRYSYRRFIKSVDAEIRLAFGRRERRSPVSGFERPLDLLHGSREPIRAKPPLSGMLTASGASRKLRVIVGRIAIFVWQKVPLWARPLIKTALGRN
jgi:hypothetical protein